jgi:hypothetical protein
MAKTVLRFIFFLFPAFSLCAQLRSFNQVFPTNSGEQRNAAFSAAGYFYSGTTENITLLPLTGGNIVLTKASLGKNPGFFVEALRITSGRTALLRIYNALEKIQDLKGRVYHSATRNRYIPLFENAVRIEGPQKIRSFLPDPAPALVVSPQETMYVRLTDANFGHCYYEISLTSNRQGILCTIRNFKNVSFGPIPVMRANTLTALLYLEPIEEGLAVYCLAGVEVSDFIAKHVDIPSALTKRMDVIIDWILDGLR